MLLLSNYIKLTIFCLLFYGMPSLANSPSDSSPSDEICFFYKYIHGTNDYSDPANQVMYFIKKRWIELENDLARGYGEEFNYVNGLAKCPYKLPEKFWQTYLKGLPFEQRGITFTNIYLENCFCLK